MAGGQRRPRLLGRIGHPDLVGGLVVAVPTVVAGVSWLFDRLPDFRDAIVDTLRFVVKHKGEVVADLKVLARDDEGREAVALFQMFIGEQAPSSPQSRDSFSEKLRMAGKRPISLVRVGELSKTHGRDGTAIRVRAG